MNVNNHSPAEPENGCFLTYNINPYKVYKEGERIFNRYSGRNIINFNFRRISYEEIYNFLNKSSNCGM